MFTVRHFVSLSAKRSEGSHGISATWYPGSMVSWKKERYNRRLASTLLCLVQRAKTSGRTVVAGVLG